MPDPTFANRTFAVMDNLPFLERLPDESVDLINIDPPFGKMETFRREAKPPITEFEKAEERDLFLAHGLSLDDRQHLMQLMVEGGSKVDDIFTWDDDISGNRSHKSFYDRIEAAESGSMARRVHRVIEATRETAGDNQAAYICFMAVRLVHCYRVLKPTGSIYVHCDYKSDSHLRMLLDAIFGSKRMRNAIAWSYGKVSNSAAKKFLRAHDTLLFYAKGTRPVYNTLYEEEVSPRKKQLIERGYNTKNMGGDRYLYIYDEDAFRVRESEGRISREDFDIVRYVDPTKGNRVTDVFAIDHLNSQATENAGYATQKPLALAKRIIEASSNPGDLVVDVFAGCATTLVAAEVTGRRWIGCDWAYRAWTMNKRRFALIPDDYGGPMRLSGTTDATLRALALEGVQIPPLESVTIGPLDLGGLPIYSIEGVELAVASAKRRDPTWTGRYSKEEAKQLMLDQWGPICWGCGWEPRMPDGVTPNEFYLQVDHSLARSLGGEDELYNLGLLCPECNARKRDREMEIVELRQENERRNAIHMSLAELNRRVPLLQVRKWARVKMDERPRLATSLS